MMLGLLRHSDGVPSAIFLPKSSTVMLVGDVHDEAHVVLHDDDGDPRVADPAHSLVQSSDRRPAQAGRGLVQEEESGLGRQGTGYLHQATLAVREVGGKRVTLLRDTDELAGTASAFSRICRSSRRERGRAKHILREGGLRSDSGGPP